MVDGEFCRGERKEREIDMGYNEKICFWNYYII